jgi:ABC-2 type transport system ATP-binding protein
MNAVTLQNLSKTYEVPEREGGLQAAFKSLFRRTVREIHAVENVSFDVAPGEIVGFLGPNGAGKTTTLNMLSGLLYPTSGEVSVLGHVPFKREKDLLRQITLVMGQRNQLVWDIPVIDSFERNRAVYRIPQADYKATLDELCDLLEIGDLLTKPVRNLSLGERMKSEIAAALLHRPQVLFLDEPTIGVDVTMQRRIRTFLAEYNKRYGATILLTSHYMADVEALCKRVIIIHNGSILFDGNLSELIQRFSADKTTVVDVDTENADLSSYGEVVHSDGTRITLRVPKARTPEITGRLLADLPIIDLTVEDPPIEEVIEQVFSVEKLESDQVQTEGKA